MCNFFNKDISIEIIMKKDRTAEFLCKKDVCTPLRYLLKSDTLWGLEQLLCSQMTLVSPKSSKCNISISNSRIAFKFYTKVKYLKLHKTIVNDYINTQTAFADDTCIPQIFKMQYLHR